jgi:hypothetical protein
VSRQTAKYSHDIHVHMWRPNVAGSGRRGPYARPIAVAGSNFLQSPSVGSVLGGRPNRRHHSGRGLGLRNTVLNRSGGSSTTTVTCIACGASVQRDEAREYDKHGDRWEREGKTFEHLCKRCHGDIDHQPREDLEAMLVEFEARDRPREEFVEWYCGRMGERDGPLDRDEQ